MARQSGVRILFAIESGSRAWGFPSPDSDYDCRFVYVWPPDDHLVLETRRDVIEFPIEGDIDAGGWDLRKALLLALKGNAVIYEWVRSPFAYEEVGGFRASLATVLGQIIEPRLVARHYLGLLHRQSPGSGGDTKLKRLFYAIRPALALQYMAVRDFHALPPMDLPHLLEGATLDAPLRALIDSLLETKKVTREMGTGSVPGPLAEYLAQTLSRYQHIAERLGEVDQENVTHRYRIAQDFYRTTVLETAKG
jgi:predicted nucleotidyltransferase